MKTTSKIIFAVFILFISLIFFWALFIPKEDVSSQIHKTLKEQEKKADVSFKDVIFEEISAGNKYWDLLAQSAMLNKSTQVAALKKAKGTFYKKGKAVLLFRSPAALWKMREKEILLDKPLGYDILLEPKINQLLSKIANPQVSAFFFPLKYSKGTAFWFYANNLSWKLADQKLLCQGSIVLNKGEVAGFCDELESDVAFEKAVMRGNPYIVISPDRSSPISLEAQVFEVLSRQDMILASGAPKVVWESAMITCDNIQYRQDVKLLNLFGKVKIVYNDIVANGQSADYNIQKSWVVLEGNASAVQGANHLTGEKVKVDLKNKKVSVMGKGKVIISGEGNK